MNNSDRHNLKENRYLGNPLIKKDNVKLDFTEHEVKEYIKCAKDPIYFCKKYIKVISLDEGLVNFKLYDYQEELIKVYNENRFSIVLACRQSGKSITTVGYILWYLCFHADKTVFLLANKGATAREMLGRLTLMLENLPFFLQPGCKELNKGSISFSNNSKVRAASTSSNSIRGVSANLIVLDELAFIYNDQAFFTGVYPVITSGKDSKVIITSTANGMNNMFYKVYQGAVNKSNEFVATRVDWWQVPGRDEKWKEQTIANTSERQFAQEFGNDFFGTSKTLIDGNVLMGLLSQKPKSITYNEAFRVYEEPQPERNYALCVDTSKGRGQDYSAFCVIDYTNVKEMKQVATFYDNKYSPLLLPDVIYKIGKAYNNATIFVETNEGYGLLIAKELQYELDYDNMFNESAIKQSGLGLTMTKKVKRLGCSHLKDLIEQGNLQIVDENTITEIVNFVEDGNSYAATEGNHDDLVMCLVIFAWAISTDVLQEDHIKGWLFENEKAVEDDVPFAGFFDNDLDEFENF